MASGAGALPRPTFAQLVGLEVAAAAVVGGLAAGGGWSAAWSVAGIATGAAVALLTLLPVGRRWLYGIGGSLVRWAARRRGRVPGLAGVLGTYRVESVPGGRKGLPARPSDGDPRGGGRGAGDLEAATIGVARSGDLWTVPLLLSLDDVLGADPGVPVAALAGLLEVEDVPLAMLRLLTVSTPARVPPHAPAAPGPPVDQFAARYLLLTVDARRAADALASRGGDRAAVEQVVRRCVVAAEQAMANIGIRVRRLDEGAVAGLFAAWLGPAAPAGGRRAAQPVESWRDVRVAGTWSLSTVVSGAAPGAVGRSQRLAAGAPTPIVASALVLAPGRGGQGGQGGREPVATLVVRFSAPDTPAAADAAPAIRSLAEGYGLTARVVGGEQAPLLRLTSPVGAALPGAGLPAGAVPLRLAADEVVPAPPTGIAVGVGADGPVHLRLFRLAGTRVVSAAPGGGLDAALLLALRAATSGIPVEVVTTRPDVWRPLIGHGPGSRIRTPDEAGRASAGPVLVVDDRPGAAVAQRALGEVRAWQCRLEVRGGPADSPNTADGPDGGLGSVARADLLILGAVPTGVAMHAVTAFGVSPEAAAALPRLEAGVFALLRRGRLDYVRLDPGAAEQGLLDAASTAAARLLLSSSR